jgi:hypothetical protein
MTQLHQDVITKLQGLSPEDLEKVLQFVDSLALPQVPTPQRKGLRGRFAHLGIHISAEDIDVARKEAWANFPRELPHD